MAAVVYKYTKEIEATYLTFSAWISAIGSDERSIIIATDTEITGTVTVPSNIDIAGFYNGAKFTGTGTLTINKMSCDPQHQIFDIGLTVSLLTRVSKVTWFGGSFSRAISALSTTGGDVLFTGTHVLNSEDSPDSYVNGVSIPFKNVNTQTQHVNLKGYGSAILKAGANNMCVVRLSDSHCEIGGFCIDGNGYSGVVAVGLLPDDINQTTIQVWQNYNLVSDIEIKSCDEAIMLKTGPDVSGADSGCWYNKFTNIDIFNCVRGLWLRSGPNVSAAPCNRNCFTNIRVAGVCNTGLQIDAGDSNTFYNVNFESVNDGTTPSISPTAIIIEAADEVGGAANNHNKFYGTMVEASTEHVVNKNTYTEFYGCTFALSGLNLIALPRVMIGGNDPSATPTILPGYVYQGNSQIVGIPNNRGYLPTMTVPDASITDAVITNAKITNLDIANSRYVRIFTMADIPAGSSASTEILTPMNSKKCHCKITIVGYSTKVGSVGVVSIVANVIARWSGSGYLDNYGIIDIEYSTSIGRSDIRDLTGITLTLSESSNIISVVLTSTSVAAPITDINILTEETITT